MRIVTHGFLWLFLYVVLAVAPLFFAFAGEAPEGRGFWTELSVGLGFVGLAVLGLQFAVTARSNGVDAPYGLDIVLKFHKEMSFVGLAFVLAHPLMLFVSGAADWALLNVVDAPWRARFGVASVVALLAIIATSLWKERLRLRYEVWRLVHGVLAVVVVVTALVHVQLVGHYVSGPWRQALWAAMSLSVVSLLVWVRVVKPVLILRRPWVVERVVAREGDTSSVVLRPDGHDGMRFQPGQFAWITVGRSPLRITEHPFSFSSSAEDHDRIEFTIKALGDFTSTVAGIEPGTDVYLDGPYGVFTYERNEAPGFVFVAGGIGITPTLSMAPDAGRPRRPPSAVARVRQQRVGRGHVPGRAGGAAGALRPAPRPRAERPAARLGRRGGVRDRGVAGRAAARSGSGAPGVLHLRPRAHDGCCVRGARGARHRRRSHPQRALRLHLGADRRRHHMRQRLTTWVVLGLLAIFVLASVFFALIQS